MTTISRTSTRAVAIRVALFWIGYLAVLVGFGILKGMLPAGQWRELAWGGCSAAVLALMTLGFERRPAAGVSSSTLTVDRGTAIRFAIGAGIGMSVVAINLMIVRLFIGPIRLTLNTHAGLWASAAMMLATFIALSCMEELGFRGYPLRALTGAVGSWRAQVIVAVAFGLTHLIYGWSLSSIPMGVIPGGILFGAAAVASRGLAMPIAVHAALNMALWSVGSKGTPGILTVIVPPESQARLDAVAPLLGVAVVLVLAALLLQLSRRPRAMV